MDIYLENYISNKESNTIILSNTRENQTQSQNQSQDKHQTQLYQSKYKSYIVKCFKLQNNVIKIEASYSNIITIHLSSFINLPNLEYISIKGNKLSRLDNIDCLLNLKTLILDENFFKMIPNSVVKLKKLTCLSASHNLIQYIQSGIVNLGNCLETLLIAYNKLSFIPIEIGKLVKLKTLSIEGNYLIEIPTTLANIPSLCELSFEWFEYLEPRYDCFQRSSIDDNENYYNFEDLFKFLDSDNLNNDTIEYKVNTENINFNINQSKSNSNPSVLSKFKNYLLKSFLEEGILYMNFIHFISIFNNQSQKNQMNTNKSNSHKQITAYQNKSKSHDFSSAINTMLYLSSFSENRLNPLLIFSAIDKNYVGIIINYLKIYPDYIKIKNNDGRTPLYYAIHMERIEILEILLRNINLKILKTPFIYLHKAIRTRNPSIVKMLLFYNIDSHGYDDQGSNAFHILFSCFSKEDTIAKCTLIGDMLIRQELIELNHLNKEIWGPIHIASRRGRRECLEWIFNQNKKLSNEGREGFDLNLKGKNGWTPLHLSVNGYRFEESLLLLKNGSKVMILNNERKSARQVANGNYLLTKIIKGYEQKEMMKRIEKNLPREEEANKDMEINKNSKVFQISRYNYIETSKLDSTKHGKYIKESSIVTKREVHYSISNTRIKNHISPLNHLLNKKNFEYPEYNTKEKKDINIFSNQIENIKSISNILNKRSFDVSSFSKNLLEKQGKNKEKEKIDKDSLSTIYNTLQNRVLARVNIKNTNENSMIVYNPNENKLNVSTEVNQIKNMNVNPSSLSVINSNYMFSSEKGLSNIPSNYGSRKNINKSALFIRSINLNLQKEILISKYVSLRDMYNALLYIKLYAFQFPSSNELKTLIQFLILNKSERIKEYHSEISISKDLEKKFSSSDLYSDISSNTYNRYISYIINIFLISELVNIIITNQYIDFYELILQIKIEYDSIFNRKILVSKEILNAYNILHYFLLKGKGNIYTCSLNNENKTLNVIKQMKINSISQSHELGSRLLNTEENTDEDLKFNYVSINIVNNKKTKSPFSGKNHGLNLDICDRHQSNSSYYENNTTNENLNLNNNIYYEDNNNKKELIKKLNQTQNTFNNQTQPRTESNETIQISKSNLIVKKKGIPYKNHSSSQNNRNNKTLINITKSNTNKSKKSNDSSLVLNRKQSKIDYLSKKVISDDEKELNDKTNSVEITDLLVSTPTNHFKNRFSVCNEYFNEDKEKIIIKDMSEVNFLNKSDENKSSNTQSANDNHICYENFINDVLEKYDL